MENENIQQTPMQAEPSNMEEALKLLREKDKAPAPADVGNAETDKAGDTGEVISGNGLPGGEVAPENLGTELEVTDTTIGAGEDRGSADTIVTADGEDSVAYTAEDYQDIQGKLIESVRRQAAMATNEKFRQEGIEKVTLTELYQRDEDTGRVSFHNPDDPDRPFENRAQAQAWVDSYNAQIEAEWVKYANQMQQQFAQQTLPTMRLMAFAPTYNAMDPKTQQYFDRLIRNYGIKDSTGELIGYSCDLNYMYEMARDLAAIDGGTGETTVANAAGDPVAKAPSGPALDATTSGSDTSSNKPDMPKNLNEAFKMVNKSKKEKK